jgi:hypothetical protein
VDHLNIKTNGEFSLYFRYVQHFLDHWKVISSINGLLSEKNSEQVRQKPKQILDRTTLDISILKQLFGYQQVKKETLEIENESERGVVEEIEVEPESEYWKPVDIKSKIRKFQWNSSKKHCQVNFKYHSQVNYPIKLVFAKNQFEKNSSQTISIQNDYLFNIQETNEGQNSNIEFDLKRGQICKINQRMNQIDNISINDLKNNVNCLLKGVKFISV